MTIATQSLGCEITLSTGLWKRGVSLFNRGVSTMDERREIARQAIKEFALADVKWGPWTFEALFRRAYGCEL